MTTTTTKTALTPSQAGRVDRARRALAREHGSDIGELAYRVGQLEWWIGDLLALIDDLTGDGS